MQNEGPEQMFLKLGREGLLQPMSWEELKAQEEMTHELLYKFFDVAIANMSVMDRINQMEGLSDEEKAMVVGEVAGSSGVTPELTSFYEALYLHSLLHFNHGVLKDATLRHRIAGGTSSLALTILKDFIGDILSNTEVTKISQSKTAGVTVTAASGKTYLASRVISTLPLNVSS